MQGEMKMLIAAHEAVIICLRALANCRALLSY